MSKDQKAKVFRSSSKKSPIDSRWKRASARLPSDYSPPTQAVKGLGDRVNLFTSFDYQLTVRPKVDLTRYQVSMLLEIKAFEVIRNGIDFVSWLTIEYLFSRLLGSRKVWEVREETERRVLTLSNMILLASKNSWMSLGERTQLSESLLSYLEETDLLPSERTINSRIEYWQPEKFLECLAVRLDVFLERETNSIPYSSYCKGYGESSSMGRRRKTRPSAELDGEETDRPEVFLTLKEIKNLLFLNLLEIQKNAGRFKA